MLSDDELQALRDIERRLRWESPELVRLFEQRGATAGDGSQSAGEDQSAAGRGRAHRVGATGTTPAQRGRSPDSEAPAAAADRAVDTAIADRADPVSGPAAPAAPIAVVDIFLGAPTVVATPLLSNDLTFHQNSSPSSPTSTDNRGPGGTGEQNDRPLRTGRRVRPRCALAGNQPTRRQTIRTRRRLPIRPRANRRSRTGTDDADPDRRPPHKGQHANRHDARSPPKTASPATT